MLINLTDIDTTEFNVKLGEFCGEECYLVTPALQGTTWSAQNAIFRSSIWDKKGKLVSAGLKRFTNWGESPDEFPIPESLNNTNLFLKLDGSLAIVNFYNSRFNIRTRGTFCVDNTITNWREFHDAINKYPKIKGFLAQFAHLTLVFEHTSPQNQIIIRYPEVNVTLLNVIDNRNYTYWRQGSVSELAALLAVPRPKQFHFNTVDDILATVKEWDGEEGVCLYSDKDQKVHKIKANLYLKKHAFRSNLSLKNILELFLDQNQPTKTDFLNYIETTFDFESRGWTEPFADQIDDVRNKINETLDIVKSFVNSHKSLPRKEFAMKAKKNMGEIAALCFAKLDGKELDRKMVTKLYYSKLEL